MLDKYKSSRIAVLMGGKSREREISFKSGEAILASLERQGYTTIAIDACDNLAADLLEHKPDVAIIALHGRYGEDGTVQGMLEIMGIPYSGCGLLSSAICMDKVLTKKLLAKVGINVADNYEISDVDDIAKACAQCPLDYPLVVKANREGSTVGIYQVRKA
jgi:D-alanine-D-alanine ligase